jgi:mannose-1-phosphate guanylyltransferase / mannose-6-phosphate isomerase
LWPVSREGHPKPFMKLSDGETLLEKTYRRAAKLLGLTGNEFVQEIVTVTNRDYYFMTRDELHKAGASGPFLLEPCGRNTAPAIAMAAQYVLEKFGPDAVMLVLSADHLIQDEIAFADAVRSATELASSATNFLVTFGIVPKAAETGFGYIKAGGQLGNAFQVEAFVEKPDAATAQKYLESGNYFWNAGMFCFQASQFLTQLSLYAPNVALTSKKCWEAIKESASSGEFMLEIPEPLFCNVEDISVDYAVMERSNKVAVIPSDIGWSDIGSWGAIRELVEPDSQNNRAYGDVIFVNSHNTFVQSEDRLVAAVGLDNLMIVDTPDALLVAHPDFSQDVKTVVNLLKKLDHDAFKLHKTVCRPWGTYTVLEEESEFKMKRIEVKPGGRLSLQMHEHRSEHWVVVKGEAIVINGDEEILVKQNESTYIPAGHKHRLENRTNQALILIEVQCGTYLGEDDIVRFEDNYGRV